LAQTAVPAGAADTRVASLGLSIVANPAAGVTTLTREQVGGLFSGRTTNWKQLGGADLKVVVIARSPGSAPQTAFEKVYINGAHPMASAEVRVGTADALGAVAATNGAVSFIYTSETRSVDGVAIIEVSDVRPTDASGVVDLGTVGAATAAGVYQFSPVISPASYQYIGRTTARPGISAIAPTQAGLDSLGVHSLITRNFIEENSSPLSEYTRIATIAPGVANTGAVNGPGLSEQKLIIRGFGNDFTNVTFDGVPESDTNDPSYHSTSFFPEFIVGGVDVVRGPGFASNHGYATFGGSENVFSIAPSETRSLTLSTSAGTWNTQLFGALFQSGRQPWLGNGTLMLSFQNTSSDGYLTRNNILSRNYSVKYEKQFGEHTLLDVFGTWNDQSFNSADAGPGATLYELTTFGPNYSLNSNPLSGECACYNFQIKTTDLGYIRLRSELPGGWNFDNRLYTYRYDNETTAANTVGLTSTQAAAGALPSQGTITCIASPAGCTGPLTAGSLASNGLVYNPNNIGGYLKRNKYIAVGDIVDFTKNFDRGYVRAGAWLEHSDTDRHQYSVDLTTGAYDFVNGSGCLYGSAVAGTTAAISGATPTVTAINCAAAAAALPSGLKQLPGPNSGALANGVPIGAVKFDQQSQILNAQPFVEGQLVLPTGTTLYAGLKHLNITRYDIAQIQNTSRTPNSTNRLTYQDNLPYFSLNQTLTPQTSFFFQYGRAYEIPDLKTFYINNPQLNSATPNQSATYQVGLVGKSRYVAWDVDYYTINFSNQLITQPVDAAGNICAAAAGCPFTAFFNIGGAKYRGFESEATVDIGSGFAVYANLATTQARELTFNTQVPNVPDMTAATGLLFKSPRFDASAIYKLVGWQFLNSYGPSAAATAAYFDPTQQIPTYGLLDLAFTWKSPRSTLQLNLYNVTSSQPYTTALQTALTSSGLMIHIAPPSMLATYKYKI
jgi:iron complex outermembrane receptor protein